MIIKLRHLEQLGFQGSSPWKDSQIQSLLYKSLPECHAVLVVSNLTPQSIQVFRLTLEDYVAYDTGKAGLVPAGCCNPSGGRDVGTPAILYQGEFQSARHVQQLIKLFEATLRSEKGKPLRVPSATREAVKFVLQKEGLGYISFCGMPWRARLRAALRNEI